MKFALAAVTCLILVATTPALSAPPWIEDYCWAQAAQIRFNGRGEREHFIANCIADLTPTPSARRGLNKKPASGGVEFRHGTARSNAIESDYQLISAQKAASFSAFIAALVDRL